MSGKLSLRKIVSGGQTGVDRGALDAAIDAAFPCGGWCPQGRMAEDGAIPETYPVTELAARSYEERTVRNVLDSDGTAIIYFAQLEGGTRQTLTHCSDFGKPHVSIDASALPPGEASRLIAAFVEHNDIAVLNVAGPRASKWTVGHAYAYQTIARLLKRAAGQ